MGGGGEALSCEETPQVTIPWKFRLMVGGVSVGVEDGDMMLHVYTAMGDTLWIPLILIYDRSLKSCVLIMFIQCGLQNLIKLSFSLL